MTAVPNSWGYIAQTCSMTEMNWPLDIHSISDILHNC